MDGVIVESAQVANAKAWWPVRKAASPMQNPNARLSRYSKVQQAPNVCLPSKMFEYQTTRLIFFSSGVYQASLLSSFISLIASDAQIGMASFSSTPCKKLNALAKRSPGWTRCRPEGRFLRYLLHFFPCYRCLCDAGMELLLFLCY